MSEMYSFLRRIVGVKNKEIQGRISCCNEIVKETCVKKLLQSNTWMM